MQRDANSDDDDARGTIPEEIHLLFDNANRQQSHHGRSFNTSSSSSGSHAARGAAASSAPKDKGKAVLSRTFEKQQHHGPQSRQRGAWTAMTTGSSYAKKAGESDGTPSSPIQRLPAESLAHVFSRLPPHALRACALVCRNWHALVQDDSTWKAAFVYHFSLDERMMRVPGHRLAPDSWRAEFTLRHDLAQKWIKSKIPTVTHDPRIGTISFIHADVALQRQSNLSIASPSAARRVAYETNAHGSSPSMLSVSLARGVASRSDPFNGKVAKGGFIEGAPLPGFHLMAAAADVVTRAAVSRDGAALVWGMANGSVTLSRTGLTGRFPHGQAQRAPPPASLGTVFHNHFGPVTSMRFFAQTEIFVTSAVDGVAKLWDCSSGCVWTSTEVLQLENGRIDEGLECAIEPEGNGNAILALGGRSGLVHCWRVDMRSYSTRAFWKIASPSPAPTVASVASGGLTPAHPPSMSSGVATLLVDARSQSLLVRYKGDARFFRRHLRENGTTTATVFGNGEGLISEITAVAIDFNGEDTPDEVKSQSGGVTITVHPGYQQGESSAAPSSTVATKSGVATPTTTSRFAGFGSLSYIVAGDSLGRTFMWDWNAVEGVDGIVQPFKRLQGFEMKVTSIEINELLILIGSADGTIRAYDLLSGRIVRIFNERSAPRQTLRLLASERADAEEEAKWAVSQIVTTRGGFVASIGARVLAWRAGDDHIGKRKLPRGGGGRLSSRAERYRTEMELKQDIRESTAALDYEHSDRLERLRQLRQAQSTAGIPRSLGDMTEDEAIAFAMILSQEEEERRLLEQTAEMSIRHDGDDDDDLDMDALQLDEDAEYHGDQQPIASTSRSSLAMRSRQASSTGGQGYYDEDDERRRGSGPASPAFRASSYTSQHLSPLSSSMRSGSGSVGGGKIQVSPRLYPQTYSPRSPSPIPDFSETADWPLPSPAAGSSTASAATSPVPTAGSSMLRRASQARERVSSHPASPSPSPSLRPIGNATVVHSRWPPDASSANATLNPVNTPDTTAWRGISSNVTANAAATSEAGAVKDSFASAGVPQLADDQPFPPSEFPVLQKPSQQQQPHSDKRSWSEITRNPSGRSSPSHLLSSSSINASSNTHSSTPNSLLVQRNQVTHSLPGPQSLLSTQLSNLGRQKNPAKAHQSSSDSPRYDTPSPFESSSNSRAHQRQQQAERGMGDHDDEEEMDEELRFVLELSRAEEESRQAAAAAPVAGPVT